MTKRQNDPTFDNRIGEDRANLARSEPRFGQAPAYLQHTTIHQKVSGYAILTGPDGDIRDGETQMCKHCGFHWVIQPGSGISRGFCLNCNGVTCGKPTCETTCTPLEKKMEEREKMAYLDRERRAVLQGIELNQRELREKAWRKLFTPHQPLRL